MGKDLNGKELGTGLCQNKQGRYVIRWTDYYGKRYTRYATKLKEAREILAKGQYKSRLGTEAAEDSNITLNELFDIYCEFKEGVVTSGTLHTTALVYNKFIRYSIGDISVRRISRIYIRQQILELANSGVGNPVYFYKVLTKLLNFAVQEGYMVKNPVKGIPCPDIPQQRRKTATDKVLTQKEQESFISFFNTTNYAQKYAYLFLLGSGLRIGELLALQHTDLDLNKRLITVNKTVKVIYDKEGKSQVTIGCPKTTSGNRKVPLTDLALQAYKGQLGMLKANKIKYKPTDVVFPYIITRTNTNKQVGGFPYISKLGRGNGTVLNTTPHWCMQFTVLLSKLTEQYPDFPQITLHSLRHTFATRCYELGISPKATQNWLGHSNLFMTSYYQHLTSENLQPEAEKLCGLISDTTSG